MSCRLHVVYHYRRHVSTYQGAHVWICSTTITCWPAYCGIESAVQLALGRTNHHGAQGIGERTDKSEREDTRMGVGMGCKF